MCPVQKSLLDPLELVLKAVVSRHADAETQTQVLNSWGISLIPTLSS